MATPPEIALAVPSPPFNGGAPPHNLEAEQSVLGAILLSERSLYALVIEEGLRPEDFYRERHRVTYAAMLELYNANEPIDPLTVTEALRQSGRLEDAGGEEAIDALTGAVPLVGNARRYAQIVKENALLRRLLTTTYEIQASVTERRLPPRDLVEQAEKAMLEVAHDDKQQDFRSIDEILHDELDKMQRLSAEGTALTGTPSGFKDLDEITGGFQPGNLIILAARPSMGKSALVTNIAENAAIDYGRPVALFSLEMSETELAQRFVASQGRIFGDKLRKGRVQDSEWPKILEATKKLSAAPLYVDDSSDIGILDIRAKARRLHQQAPGGLGLIIIDYLQLMRPDAGTDSRVEQVGQMSRGLKILARELSVPVIALSQLSRAVEQRHDKKPILSDLRECVTGDTLVMLADGRRMPIADLVGTTPEVMTIDEHDRVAAATSDCVWRVGRRPVLILRLASGRILRATGEHRVRAFDGWRHVGDLAAGDRVALARRLPEPATPVTWPDDHVVLLGQMVGDGSYLSGQPMRYTTASEDNSEAVAVAARRGFGCTVTRHSGRGSWHQLVISGNGTRWAPAGVNAWLRRLGIFGQRSHEKRIPAEAFQLDDRQVALLLRHLWASDGSIWSGHRSTDGRPVRRVAYSTISPGLASDVAALLLRLGIVVRIATAPAEPGVRPTHHVLISDAVAHRRFLETVGAFGPRREQADRLAEARAAVRTNTNVDTLPAETWIQVKAAMAERGVTHREMATLRGTSYGGAAHFNFAPSRTVLLEYADLLGDESVRRAASSDLFWDRVVSVTESGEEDVYDLTVPGTACWLADGIVTHNSGQIEQDADLVMFIYRDEYYEKDESEHQGLADILIAKHRNGGLGDVTLTFRKEYPKFLNYAGERYA